MADQPAVAVRRRTDADLEAAATVLVDVHVHDRCPAEGVADPTSLLTGPRVTAAWVAELGGRIVGHVGISSPRPGHPAAEAWAADPECDGEPVAVLERLFVAPVARRNSAGFLLVEAATDCARAAGLRLVLDVMAREATAIRLYERLGWRRIGRTFHDHGRGALIPALLYVGPSVAP